ncbi:acid phosphatase 1-like [Quillaja saponaria]|uniref:Acid phosphatase 1-like n=1 Tax=Quillaja saponaria TaxID=32244 RepID=A0AAD7L512_QUISA|nr:acid phosphatase 1-like [Quillaja saponaria]
MWQPCTVLIFLATLIVVNCQNSAFDITNQIHLLRPKSGSGGDLIPGISCSSWRLGVEAHNIIDWKLIPTECEDYVGHYMLGKQYREDSKVVASEAFAYANGLNLTNDGNNIWIFDIDETTLSNLPYYADHGFGAELFNATSFNEWVDRGEAPALPESLELYNKLLSLGIKAVFLTGREEDQREVTVKNLKQAGYNNWEKLILKDSSFSGKTAVFYKSSHRRNLEKKGYKIIGNIGDQWSDLLGTPTGNRTFKLPDPMYYIG